MIQFTYASVPAPGCVNEDFVIAGPTWVAVFDGATPRAGVASGCIHDVPWLVAHLAADITRSLTLSNSCLLTDALAHAIQATCDAHQCSCDLSNPDSPSATAAIMRVLDDHVDYLVLGDSPILARVEGRLQVITDERSARLPSYTPESVRAHRNQPHGFWVASTRPEAGHHAITGTIPLAELDSAAVLSDGVTRYVDRVALGTWEDLDRDLRTVGPVTVIDRIRRAEEDKLPEVSFEPNGRMVKRHDDASAIIMTFEKETEGIKK